LASPHPLGERLPALYQDDSLALRFTAALDEVLAPVFNSLDNLDSYLDPELSPEDFLDWLAGWLGLVLDEDWPAERRRAFVARASDVYRIRGTHQGLVEHVRLVTGKEVEITESGATAWSTTTGAPLPGRAGFELVVRPRAEPGSELDMITLDSLVAASKPAHVLHRVEVVKPPAPKPAPPKEPEPPPPAGDSAASEPGDSAAHEPDAHLEPGPEQPES
jgi:phage tail-like protein